MNIFARPLFEAVTDILPAMHFAVDEMLTNKAVWERKIDNERQRKRKLMNTNLGLLTSGFSEDPTPSPMSDGPAKPVVKIPLSAIKTISPEEAARRGSTGSIQVATASESRRSSLAVDQSSRRSSTTALGGQRGLVSGENTTSSRRGSRDPSLTAILVTQTANASDPASNGPTPSPEDRSKGDRKDTLTRASSPKKERDNVRPVTAPSHARRSQGKHSRNGGPAYHL
jgi:3',5'-cyclic-nucleotide phosphodiesterase